MKKSLSMILALVILLSLACLLSSCSSNEKKGVPEDLILAETDCWDHLSADEYEDVEYELVHEVNTDTHIDRVELKMWKECPYGTKVINQSFRYQYDKSSDLWSLIEKADETYSFSLNEEALINGSPWYIEGNCGDDEEFQCDIWIRDFDVADTSAEDKSIWIEYDFSFLNGPQISGGDIEYFRLVENVYWLHMEFDYKVDNYWTDTKTFSANFTVDPYNGLESMY